VSTNDGLVLHRSTLNGRQFTEQVSVPYLRVRAERYTQAKGEPEWRPLELVAGPGGGHSDVLEATLASTTCESTGDDELLATATYRIENLLSGTSPQHGGGRSTLTVTQEYRFQRDIGSCEPTGTLACARFWPTLRYAYDGLRPLQKVKGGPEAAISRRHAVLDHSKLGGARGVYSVVGGKLSTFRPLAEEVVARLDPPRKRTDQPDQPPAGWRESLLASGLPKPSLRHLRMYGAAIPEVLALGREVLCEHSGAIAGEVRHAIRNEHVTTLGDIMLRRTGISWASCRGLCCHRQIAAIAAEEAGWTPEQVTDQVRAFEQEVAYHLPTEESLAADHFAAG